MKSNQKFKKKGMMLLSAVLAAFLLTMVASGYFMTLTGSFNAIKSGGEAIQAQRYAEIEANKLSLLAYNDLDSKVSQNVWKKSDADEGWEYKVNLGPEKVVDPSTNSKQRIATVSIRKEGDSTERFSMKVPVSVSDSSGDGKIGDEKELIWYTNENHRGVHTVIKESGFLYFNLSPFYPAHTGGGKSTRFIPSSGSAVYLNGREIARNSDGKSLITVPVKKGDVIRAYRLRGDHEQSFAGWCSVHHSGFGPCKGQYLNQGKLPGNIGTATFRPLK